MRPLLDLPMLAVGAAFDYHAGLLRKPPAWMQRYALEWLWRLGLEPARLWRRYLILNPAYLGRLAAQKVGVWRAVATGSGYGAAVFVRGVRALGSALARYVIPTESDVTAWRVAWAPLRGESSDRGRRVASSASMPARPAANASVAVTPSDFATA